MLRASGKAVLVYEPFNYKLPKAIEFGCPLKEHYHRVTSPEAAGMREYIDRRIADEMALQNPKGRDVHVILKDPIAFASAEWIEAQYGSRVIVTVRHPAAYVASMKRVGWPMNPAFALQPCFRENFSPDFLKEVSRRVDTRPGGGGFNLADAVMGWRIFHHATAAYVKRHPEWIAARHEDLSRDYVGGFRELYDQLGLTYSEDAEARIRQHCEQAKETSAEDLGTDVRVHKRDSASSIKLWKELLTEEETAFIYNNARDAWELFYKESDW